MERKIRIILAEDQAIFRTALANYLNSQFEFEVIGQAANGKDLLAEAKRLQPDVILMDLKMPVMNGYEALSAIKNRFEDLKVIIFSMVDSVESMFDLQQKGANGFVSKHDDMLVLSSAIKEVYKNGFFLHKKLAQAKRTDQFVKRKKELFSGKELSVVREVCNGCSNNEISERLFISVRTVDFHKNNIYRKIGARNVIEIMRFALKNKIVDLD
jgi:DNA-binding NarL/FixJ family response regulator